MADSKSKNKNKKQVEKQPKQQDKEDIELKPSDGLDTGANPKAKTKIQDKKEGAKKNEENVEKKGEEKKLLDECCSTGARPKAKSACAIPKVCIGPLTLEEDDRARARTRLQNKRMETLSKKLKVEKGKMERKDFCEFEEKTKIVKATIEGTHPLLCAKLKMLHQECLQIKIDRICHKQLQMQFAQLNTEFRKVSNERDGLQSLCSTLQKKTKEIELLACDNAVELQALRREVEAYREEKQKIMEEKQTYENALKEVVADLDKLVVKHSSKQS